MSGINNGQTWRIRKGSKMQETIRTESNANTEQIKLGYDEHLIDVRNGNNKKWRDPAKEKRIKKIAAASRRRNRRA